MQTINLRLVHNAIYEAGAAVVAVLAFPQDTADEQRRADLHAALCNVALRETYQGTPDECEPQLMKPVYVFRDLIQVMRYIDPLSRVLRRRMAAGHMAIPFLQEVQLGSLPPLPISIKRLNISQMAADTLDLACESDVQNMRNRVDLPEHRQMVIDNETQNPDPILLSGIAPRHEWFGELVRGKAVNMVEIAARNSVDMPRLSRERREELEAFWRFHHDEWASGALNQRDTARCMACR